MTPEEKAKRYDEALARARKLQKNSNGMILKKWLWNIFPELKESRDNRIMKVIRGWIYTRPASFFDNGISKEEILAWLEKQESCYSFEIKKGHWYKCVCDYMLNNSDLMFKNDRLYYCRSDWRLRGEIDERNVKNIGVNGYKSFFRPATNQEIKEWLEKQGKQKSTEHNENEEPQVYETNDDDVITYSETNGYKIVEPKFHEGDWVIDKQGIVHQIANVVENVTCHTYGYDIVGGGYFNDNTEGVRLWTIQDAKDGDVLFHSDSASNGIFIFKEIIDKGFAKEVICYCDYDSEDGFCLGEKHTCCWTNAKILHPATKEQRDLLFQKMKEAGYIFDFKNKEFKKIETEIEIPFGAKDSELQEATYHIPKGFYAEIDNDKVVIKKGEKPTVWSEENGRRIQRISDFIWKNRKEILMIFTSKSKM